MENKRLPKDISKFAGSPFFSGIHHIEENHSYKHARLLHTHEDEVELFFVSKGKGEYIVGDRTYKIKTGDIVICNAGVLHGDDPFKNRNVLSYCCAFQNVHIDGLPLNHLIKPDDNAVISLGAMHPKIASLMETIYLFSFDGERLYDSCNLFALGILEFVKQTISRREKKSHQIEKKSTDILAEKIKIYLDEHYSEQITLKSIGDALHMNPYYIAHVFKSSTSQSPIQYILHRRLGQAQTLLMDTFLPIGDISDMLGYNNPCHFNAMFTKYVGMSPGKYRKSFLKEESDSAQNNESEDDLNSDENNENNKNLID